MANKVLVIGCGGTGTRICNEMYKTLGYDLPTDRMATVIIDAHGSKGFEHDAWDQSRQNLYVMDSYQPINEGASKRARQLELQNPGIINDWWPKGIQLPTEGMYSDGCGAYRPYGKFFAFHYYDSIRATIKQGLERLKHSDHLSHNQQSQSSRFDVVICASLGNGTGGGIFMDVAGIVNDIITTDFEEEPRVIGFFVPSSVTWNGPRNSKGHNNLQPVQIAAAGYGALVEIQSEFSRRQTTRVDPKLVPTTPYSARFFSRMADRFDHEIKFDDRNKSPFDGVYLFDKRDDFGNIHSYNTVVNTAGQSLAAVIGGQADPTGRMLDVVLRFEEQCFGSMGVARLSVPTDDLTDALVCRMSQDIINDLCPTKASLDLNEWSDVLSLTIGAAQFPPPDSTNLTIEDYTKAFVSKFLKIQEGGTGVDDKKVNQLFDVFSAMNDAGKRTVKQAMAELNNAEGADIGEKAQALAKRVEEYLQGFEGRFGSVLMNTKWLAAPKDDEPLGMTSLDGIGCKYLIDHMVQKMLNGQAFGVCEIWLEALKMEIVANKQSVEQTELSEYLGASSFEGIETNNEALLKAIKKAKEDVMESASGGLNSFFSGLMGGSETEDLVAKFNDAVKSAVKTVTWAVKIKAAEEFYDAVLTHLDLWLNLVGRLNAYLRGSDVLGHIDKEYIKVSANLTNSSANGSITELLSCTPASQDNLVKTLKKNEKLHSKNIFDDTDFHRDIWSLLYSKLDAADKEVMDPIFSKNLGGDMNLRNIMRTKNMIVKEFPEVFLRTLRSALRPFVSPLCKVDNLLREDSKALVEEYYDKVFLDSPNLSRLEKRDVADALFEVVPSILKGDLHRIFEQRSSDMTMEQKIEQATDQVFLARIQQLANAALSKVDLKVAQRSYIQGGVTLVYGKDCLTLKKLKSELGQKLSRLKLDMTGNLSELSDFPSDQILAIGNVQGLTLNDLNMSQIYKYYRDSMKIGDEKDSRTAKNFAPHITKQYMEVGARYLSRADVETKEDYTAELVLALAYMKPTHEDLQGKFGWLDVCGLNLQVIKEMPVNLENGEVLPQCMVSKSKQTGKDRYLGPDGFDDVIFWLEGRSQEYSDGALWLEGLKKLVWNEISTTLRGDTTTLFSKPIKSDVLIAALDEQMTNLNQLLQYPTIAGACEAMIEALRRFKYDISNTPGGLNPDVVPEMLS